MPKMEIICLANSRKQGHHCIAGLRTDGSGWLRPQGTVPDGSLYVGEIILPDATLPRVLDVITLSCSQYQPKPHQPENWRIDNLRWQLAARPAPSSLLPVLRAAIAHGPELLGSRSDRAPASDFLAQPALASLALVAPENLRWRIGANHRGKRQTRACFTLCGVHYDLSVTAPDWEDRLGALPDGYHAAAAASLSLTDTPLFTISLGEPFDRDNSGNPCCFKLVAGIVVL